jgi:hypothetical protein
MIVLAAFIWGVATGVVGLFAVSLAMSAGSADDYYESAKLVYLDDRR